MDTDVVQVWNQGREKYRPAGEPIRRVEYDVQEMAKKGGPVREFVERHHYARNVPPARRQFALAHNGEIVGAAIFSVPTNKEAFASIPIPAWIRPQHCLELGRFVLLDKVPANGETLFLGECFRRLHREGFAGVVSFADPVMRTRLDGSEVMPGHIGGIYQAHNATLTGRSRARIHQLLPDGTIFSPRAQQKANADESGWRYAVATLTRFGAPAPGRFENIAAWVHTWLPVICRPLRHGGCLRYVWGLHRAIKRVMGPGLPYPKFRTREAFQHWAVTGKLAA